MANYKPWDTDTLECIVSTYAYDADAGIVYNRAKSNKRALGTVGGDGSLMINMYLPAKMGADGRVRRTIGLQAQRVAVYLHTGQQPDSIAFIDGNRTNIKWNNLRVSSGTFNSVAVRPANVIENQQFRDKLDELVLAEGYQLALKEGGYVEGDPVPEEAYKWTPYRLYKWCLTSRHLEETVYNPKNYLAPDEYAVRFPTAPVGTVDTTPVSPPVDHIKTTTERVFRGVTAPAVVTAPSQVAKSERTVIVYDDPHVDPFLPLQSLNINDWRERRFSGLPKENQDYLNAEREAKGWLPYRLFKRGDLGKPVSRKKVFKELTRSYNPDLPESAFEAIDKLIEESI